MLIEDGSGNWWSSYGSPGSTIALGQIPSFPQLAAVDQQNGGLDYFAAPANGGSYNLLVTDGSAAGTKLVSSLTGAPGNFLNAYGRAYFTVFNASQQQLWTSDGTANGTKLVTTFAVGTGIGRAQTAGSKLLFSEAIPTSATTTDTSVYETDGTPNGIQKVLDLGSGSSGGSTIAKYPVVAFTSSLNNYAFFFVQNYDNDPNDPFWDSQLWMSDGDPASILNRKLVDFGGSFFTSASIDVGTTQYFIASQGTGNPQGSDQFLWKTDGTFIGTSNVADLGYAGNQITLVDVPGQGNSPEKLYFFMRDAQGNETLWTSDGTGVGTHAVNSLAVTFAGPVTIASSVATNGRIYVDLYNTSSGTAGLYVVDPGTANATLVTNDIAAFSPLALGGGMPPLSDFNSDSTSDVLWFNPGTGTVGDWLMSNGTPAWQGIGQASASVSAKGFGDFNGNGTSDILWENPTNGVVGDWLMNNNQPTWQQIGQGSTTMNIAGVGDFNGDGTDDILWQNPANNLIGEWQMNNNVPNWQLVGQGSTTMNIAGIGDFNGDGKSDILWENPTNNLVGMWGMNGSQATWSLIGQGSTTMNIVGVGDFTGNGTTDVLWENPTNGVVGFWGMTSGQATSWNVVGTASTAYQVAGVGDYYANGTSDILWRNASTGDTGIWQMTNGQATWHGLGGSSTAFNIVKS